MHKITLKMLKEMQPHTIFADGEFLYDGGFVKWIAIRGDIYDWAIYYDLMTKSQKEIADWGAKLHDMSEVKKLVNCTANALAMYRH